MIILDVDKGPMNKVNVHPIISCSCNIGSNDELCRCFPSNDDSDELVLFLLDDLLPLFGSGQSDKRLGLALALALTLLGLSYSN